MNRVDSPCTPVPVRAIAATIAMVLAAAVAVLVVLRVERVLIWLLVSVFLTTALWPLVGVVERRTKARGQSPSWVSSWSPACCWQG